MKMQKIKLLSAVIIVLAVAASPVAAGPTWEFGPNYEGLAKIEYKTQLWAAYRDSGSGTDSDDDTMEFNFRRNRLALMGAWEDWLSLYVQAEYQDDRNIGPITVSDGGEKFYLLDAVMRFRYNDSLNLWAGKFKHVLTRENLEPCFGHLNLDRSYFIGTPLNDDGTRDKGVEVWGNLFEKRFQYRAAVTNGRNDSSSTPDSEFRYTVRGHLSLLDPEDHHGYDATYLGENKVLTIGGGYQFEDDVAFDNVTGQSGSVDYEGWTVDLFFEYPFEGIGTITLSGAYTDYDLDDAYQGVDPDPETIGRNGEKNGSYGKVGYMLPNMPLQFFGRMENWSFAQLDGVTDQEIDWYAGGFNYYIRGQKLKLTMQYSSTEFDKEVNNVEDFDTFITQLQLRF